jgi:hypothetical protein
MKTQISFSIMVLTRIPAVANSSGHKDWKLKGSLNGNPNVLISGDLG